jgi:hypothetical protein
MAARDAWGRAGGGRRPPPPADEGLSVSATFGGAGRRGRAAGHVVDPRTGAALAEPAVAAVVSASATDAEAWSKALLLWGAGGVDRIEGLGARGAVHVGDACRREAGRGRGGSSRRSRRLVR